MICLCSIIWFVFDATPLGSILAGSVVSSVRMVIVNVIPTEMNQVRCMGSSVNLQIIRQHAATTEKACRATAIHSAGLP